MVCIYCYHTDSNVINSRPHKKDPSVWRRRQCKRCKGVFTTYETLSPAQLPLVTGPQGSERFSKATLLISIYNHLSTQRDAPRQADAAEALANTVCNALISKLDTHKQPFSPIQIARETYTVLNHYDTATALRYGVAHGIITPNDVLATTN